MGYRIPKLPRTRGYSVGMYFLSRPQKVQMWRTYPLAYAVVCVCIGQQGPVCTNASCYRVWVPLDSRVVASRILSRCLNRLRVDVTVNMIVVAIKFVTAVTDIGTELTQ